MFRSMGHFRLEAKRLDVFFFEQSHFLGTDMSKSTGIK